MIIVYVVAAIVAVGLIGVATSVRVVQQFERGVIFRFGQVRAATRGPGLALIAPIADRLQKVNMQIVTCRYPARTASPGTTSLSASTLSSTTGSSTQCGWPSTSRTTAPPSCR